MGCYCGKDKSFESCCEAIHMGEKRAKTAEELMRARYSAFASGNMDFVENSHDPKFTEMLDMEATRSWAKSCEFTRLEVIDSKNGQEEDSWGQVEFKAFFKDKDSSEERLHHELSDFNRRDGHWYYSEGKDLGLATMVRATPKVGRNEPCPCGSGKKYKKCCGAA